MKVSVQNYEHASNVMSLQLEPETDAEEAVLRGFWKHGKMETGHPCRAKGETGFYIKWGKE